MLPGSISCENQFKHALTSSGVLPLDMAVKALLSGANLPRYSALRNEKFYSADRSLQSIPIGLWVL